MHNTAACPTYVPSWRSVNLVFTIVKKLRDKTRPHKNQTTRPKARVPEGFQREPSLWSSLGKEGGLGQIARLEAICYASKKYGVPSPKKEGLQGTLPLFF